MAKCQCGHNDTAHLSRTRNLPPYCSKCKSAKAGHEFEAVEK